ncbi:MAG: hypothetical protein ACLQNE_08465 [Thermoguttaceae bacterium]|jgi:hypothetical protein
MDALWIEGLADLLIGFTLLMVGVGTSFLTAWVCGGADLGR